MLGLQGGQVQGTEDCSLEQHLGWGSERMHFSPSGLVQDASLGMPDSSGWGRRQTGMMGRGGTGRGFKDDHWRGELGQGKRHSRARISTLLDT